MEKETIICQHWGNATGVFLPRTKKDQEIINNVKRVWKALRRELGENETLIEDFKLQGVEMFKNSGYGVTVDGDFILQNVILS